MKKISSFIVTALFCFKTFAVPSEGQKILVAGPSPYSAEIVREISSQGGNVVDCAVAVALALAVTTPYYASFGGGGFALVEMGKGVEALDFREMAPAKAHVDLYKDKPKNASIDGGLAVGVPGIPAGLEALHKKYGKLSWRKLFAPAEKLASSGFLVSGEWSKLAQSEWKRFNSAGRRIFSREKRVENSSALKPGDRLIQKELALLLRKLKEQGAKGFYSGEVARDVSEAVKATGGLIEPGDLANYSVRWLKPMEVSYNGHQVYMMPPPSSSGPVMTAALKIAEKMKLGSFAPLSSSEFHLWVEILKFSFRGRSLLGDPDFVKNPLELLTSDLAVNEFAEKFKPNAVMKLDPLQEPTSESAETTHFSILDTNGNSVAITVTLNGNHGSAVVSPRYGIVLNNEMDDFNTRPGQPNMFGLIQGAANNVEAGKRPLSSMSPTLVKKNGKVVLSLGSPGGPRIISAVLQVLHRTLVSNWDMDQAVQAPRIHHQFLPDTVLVDRRKLSPDIIEALTKKGHKVEESSVAKVYGVRLRDDGILEAAFDGRGEGGAGGY